LVRKKSLGQAKLKKSNNDETPPSQPIAGHGCTHVFSAMQEAEIRRIVVPGQHEKKRITIK
jgi:hypothetical protein